KNMDYSVSLGYPDRINYYLRGYGFMDRTRHGAQKNIKRSNSRSLGFSYAYSAGGSELKANLNYSTWLDKNGSELVNSDVNNYTSEFRVNTLNFNALWTRSNEHGSSQLKLDALAEEAYDRDLQLQGSNYFYNRKDLLLKYLVR